MLIRETKIRGAFLIEIEPVADERGFFARTMCRKEFEAAGIPSEFVQSNISRNVKIGLLRGMHYQRSPHEEGKLVRCARGKIFDVVVDLRPDSPTYCNWLGFELSEQNLAGLYIPPGLAHGFVTLSDEADVVYQMTEFYHPGSAAGVRWNDPAFGISWPISEPSLSLRDATYPDFLP